VFRSLRNAVRKKCERTTLDSEPVTDKRTIRSESPYHISVCRRLTEPVRKDLGDGP